MTNLLTFSNGANFWMIRYNVDSKRVMTVGGRKGTAGTVRRLVFATRDDVREYVEKRIEIKTTKKGFRAARLAA